MNWIIENDAFSSGDILLPALKKLGRRFVLWSDEFWLTREYESFPKESIFHGSLGNAAKLRAKALFEPGSLCDEQHFSYSFIAENYKDFVLSRNVIFTTISDLLSDKSVLSALTKNTRKIFVRPDSPLKEFSGRVLDSENLTPSHFDYGFYHSDLNLRIAVCEYQEIEKEYRFVCVGGKVVTGSEYLAEGRRGLCVSQNSEALSFASEIARAGKQQDFAYIIDVCKSGGEMRLVELNPFSGADLYCCDAEKIILAIENALC